MVSSNFQSSKGKEPCGMSHCLASYCSVDVVLLWCSFADPICEDDIYSPHRTMGRSFGDKCYHNCTQFLFSDTWTWTLMQKSSLESLGRKAGDVYVFAVYVFVYLSAVLPTLQSMRIGFGFFSPQEEGGIEPLSSLPYIFLCYPAGELLKPCFSAPGNVLHSSSVSPHPNTIQSPLPSQNVFDCQSLPMDFFSFQSSFSHSSTYAS